MRDLKELEQKTRDAFMEFQLIAGKKAFFEMREIPWPSIMQEALIEAWEKFQAAEEEEAELYHIINR